MKSKLISAALIVVYAAIVFGVTLGLLNILALISMKLASFVLIWAGLFAICRRVGKVIDPLIIEPLRKWSNK